MIKNIKVFKYVTVNTFSLPSSESSHHYPTLAQMQNTCRCNYAILKWPNRSGLNDWPSKYLRTRESPSLRQRAVENEGISVGGVPRFPYKKSQKLLEKVDVSCKLCVKLRQGHQLAKRCFLPFPCMPLVQRRWLT